MTQDRETWIEIAEVLPAEGEVIIGVTTTPTMITAGAARARELIAAGAPPETIAEEVYFAMRQAAGDGKPLKRVRRL